MSSRTIGPVEIAKLNYSVLRDSLRTIRTAVLPFVASYLLVGLLIASHLRPTMSPSQVLGELAVSLVVTIPLHAAIAGLIAPILVGIASLVGWRHVLARGSTHAVLRLLRVAKGASRHVPLEPSPASLAPANSSRDCERPVVPPLIEQLRGSLTMASMAPPRRPERVRTTRSVATGPLFSWRSV